MRRFLLAAAAVLAAVSCAPRSGLRGNKDPTLAPMLERLATNPDDVEARLALASARRKAGDLAGALLEVHKALASDPRSSRAHVERARIYFDRGLPDQEIDAWRAALEIEPAALEARENLGHALLAAGDTPSAIVEYRRVLDANPNAMAVLFNLAQLATDAGNESEARRLWTRYLELDPTGRWADRARQALAALPGGTGSPK